MWFSSRAFYVYMGFHQIKGAGISEAKADLKAISGG